MRLVKFCLAAISAAIMFGHPGDTWADDQLSLYQAMEIVTGTDMRERPRGFAECLTDVLIKVSGDPRLRSDPRVIAAGKRAEDYVTKFNYIDPMAGIPPKDDQGTYDRSENLTVTFDPARIDALLASLGVTPWRGPRPVLVPVLAVHGRKPPEYLLTATEPLAAEQRAAFERIAGEAGLSLRLPSLNEMHDFRMNANAPCGPDTAIVVRGRLDWSETAPGWIGTWQSCWHGQRHTWHSSGGGYDLAFANLVGGVTLLASGHGSPR